MKFLIRFNKLIALGLGLIFIFSTVNPLVALATEEKDAEIVDIYTHTYSEEEVDNGINADIERILSGKIKSHFSEYTPYSVPQYERYEYVKIESKYISGEGYAGNQSTKGMRFPTGGGFYWSKAGGPTVSPSISFGNEVVSMSVSLGTSEASSGYFVTAPNKTSYFKLRSRKTYLVTKTAVYAYPVGSSTRKFLYYIYPKSLYSESAWAVAQ